MLLESLSNSRAWTGKRLMAIPRSVLAPTTNRRPIVLPLVATPFNSMTGLPVKLVCVVASITTGSVMAGNAFVGVIVKGPRPLMGKVMVSKPGLVFAVKRAWRNEPAPLSAIFVTGMVLLQPARTKPPASAASNHLPNQPLSRENFAAPCIDLIQPDHNRRNAMNPQDG